MLVLAVCYLVTLILLFIARYANLKDEKREILNSISYRVNLVISLAIVSHELWRSKNGSRATVTSIIATCLTIAMGVVVALNIAHKDNQKDVIFGVSLSVSIVGGLLALDIEKQAEFILNWRLA